MKRQQRSHMLTVFSATVFMIFVLVGVMFFAGFWTTASTYNVSAYVSNARGIATDSNVFEAGLPVGLVTGVKRNGPDAILTLRITKGIKPLPTDTQIQLGLRSVAGEADILLYPGHSKQMIRNGGSLGLSQDQSFTEVDQILNSLQGATSPDLQKFFQAAGYGLNGEGQNLNDVLGNAAALINNSPPLTSTLAKQHTQVDDIVENFGNIMGAIGQRTQAIQEFAQGAQTTFTAVAARDVAIDHTLKELPFFLGGAKVVTGVLGAEGPHIAGIVNHLASVVTKLQPTLSELEPASSKGITLVQSLGNTSPALRNLLVDVTKLQPSASAALPALHAVLCQAEPIGQYIQPYGRDFAAFFDNFGDALNAYSDTGHVLDIDPVVDLAHIFRGVESQPASAAFNTLVNLGVFGTTGAGVGFDPEPGVGNMNQHTVGVGLSGSDQWNAAHPNSYPHVNEDCPVPAADQTADVPSN